jgi:hypothetical protein
VRAGPWWSAGSQAWARRRCRTTWSSTPSSRSASTPATRATRQPDLEGLDSFTLARIARNEAKRRAVTPPMTPPPAPTPRGLQEADQGRAFQAAWEAGWSAGWQEGWDLRSAVDVVVWYVNSRVDL